MLQYPAVKAYVCLSLIYKPAEPAPIVRGEGIHQVLYTVYSYAHWSTSRTRGFGVCSSSYTSVVSSTKTSLQNPLACLFTQENSFQSSRHSLPKIDSWVWRKRCPTL